MPWHVAETAKCPASKPYGVIKNADGSVAACHPTKEAALKHTAALYANEPGRAMADTKKPYGDVPYADPGYQADGKKRYPLTADKVQAAWSYINQADNARKYTAEQLALIKGRIKAAMAKFGHKVSESNIAEHGGEFRTVPFDIASSKQDGDGLTFEGYAAVYGHRTRISAVYEDFDEQIAPGAFRSITDGEYPVLMFEHGRHPLIGTLPLGRITEARDDSQGLWIEARLTDNWLIQPVRDAIADKAIKGMSFRFNDPGDDGQEWESRSDDVALRTLLDLDVPELGPVVFPAYEPTTAGVRSAFDKLPVIGRPTAGARAANNREGGAGQRQPQSLEERFSRDSDALALLRPLRRT